MVSSGFVRCVRGDGYKQAELVRDDANGVVIDTLTGLMWQDNERDQNVTWELVSEFMTYCEDLTLAGYEVLGTSYTLNDVFEYAGDFATSSISAYLEDGSYRPFYLIISGPGDNDAISCVRGGTD